MSLWRNISLCSECKQISGRERELVIKNKRGYKAKKHQKGSLVGSVFIQGAAEIIDKLFLGGILEFAVPFFTVKQNISSSLKRKFSICLLFVHMFVTVTCTYFNICLPL